MYFINACYYTTPPKLNSHRFQKKRNEEFKQCIIKTNKMKLNHFSQLSLENILLKNFKTYLLAPINLTVMTLHV